MAEIETQFSTRFERLEGQVQEHRGRLERLEAEMKEVRTDVAEIKEQVGKAATKQDLDNLQAFFLERDQSFNRNVWRLLYGLVGVVVLIALAAVGISLSEIGPLFNIGG